MADITEMMIQENRTRSVNSAEDILIRSVGGDVKNSDKLNNSSYLASLITRVKLSANTALALANGALAKVKNSRYATPAQVQDILGSLAAFIDDEANELPSNIAYGASSIVKAWWGMLESEGGYEIEAPAKVTKLSKEEAQAQERIKMATELRKTIANELKARMVSTFNLDPDAVDEVI
jgi:hypothetical protein